MQEHFIGSKSNTMENYPTTSDAVNDRSNQLESVEVAYDFLRELEIDYNWKQAPEAPEEIVDDWEQAPEALVEMTDDSEQSADQRPGTPHELIEIADNASKELLPAKSKQRYLLVYKSFQKWKHSKEAIKSKCASTLWSHFSMLKDTLKKVYISNYLSLSAFLKVKAKGHVPKKATILTEADITRFIDEAPDALWLDVKVPSIFATFGACRSHEFATTRMNDIKRYDDMYYVIIDRKVTKTDKLNEFAIIGRFLDIVRQYEKLRPENAEERFFLNYQKGRCTTQPIASTSSVAASMKPVSAVMSSMKPVSTAVSNSMVAFTNAPNETTETSPIDTQDHFGTTFNNSGSSRELRNASFQNRNLRRMEFNSTDEDDSKRDINTAD
ncbi:hypothetical protein Bhyg_03135, partial [Pseudolycoriella hygida]